jgi:aldehyde dehydrogenase (NAD+)
MTHVPSIVEAGRSNWAARAASGVRRYRDLDRTANIVAHAITTTPEQVYIAGSRLIAHRRIADALAWRIADKFARLKPGPTWDDGATLARSPRARNCRESGRREACARRRRPSALRRQRMGRGVYYLPTLLANVDSANPP